MFCMQMHTEMTYNHAQPSIRATQAAYKQKGQSAVTEPQRIDIARNPKIKLQNDK